MSFILNNSVPSPFVFAANSPSDYLQIAQQLIPDYPLPGKGREAKCSYLAMRLVPAAVAIANGARIGEILSIRWCQVMPNGMAWIHGEKGSRSRSVYLGFNPPTPEPGKNSWLNSLVFPWSYSKVYAACKAFGLGVVQAGHRNISVTHCGRYALAKMVEKQADIGTAAEVLGHHRTSSTEHYLAATNLEADRLRKQRERDKKKSARISAILNSEDF